MRHIIAGTAGHIDHGKTTLVRALTGIDTDRLEEEKRRGISIDLGFAHLDLGRGLRIGFVDVPGHERFVKNMLAGVGGIDLVLLVISADESIKPQTREHFQICQLLRIPRGIVVLTKADLVDREILELVQMEVEEFVAGSFLEGAPIVPVSATTGQGIHELRLALEEIAAGIPMKDATQHLRLPVDRAFTMRGFGTVVTGTLLAGTVHTEQEIELQPGGTRLRVRGLQVHGEQTTSARAGQRTAVNLSGVEPAGIPRGRMLTEPGLFDSPLVIDCEVQLLPDVKALRNRAPVHFHAGTAEIEAEVRNLQQPGPLLNGKTSYARLKLSAPLLLLPGDRFILRQFSPVFTIGGGTVLDIQPPRTRRDKTLQRLEVLATGTATEKLALLIRESAHGLSATALTRRTGMREAAILQAVAGAPDVVSIQETATWLLSREWIKLALQRLQTAVQVFHKTHPLQPGIPKEELRAKAVGGGPAFLLDYLLKQSKLLAAENDVVRFVSHKVALKQDETDAIAKIEDAFASAGLAVPSVAEVLSQSGVEPTRARSLLQILLRGRRLVRINEDLIFHPEAVKQLRALLQLRKGERFAVGAFKEWTGVSRKYAIPLLEFLDREHVTRRDGEVRIVL